MTEVSRFNYRRLFWYKAFPKNLVVTSLNAVNNWSWSIRFLCIIDTCLFTDQGPEFIKVHCGTMILVHCFVEVEHTNFSKVTRMVFTKQCSVVMLTTSITTTAGMLTVFTDTAVTSTFMSSLLAVLMESGCHCGSLISVTICSLIFFICPH